MYSLILTAAVLLATPELSCGHKDANVEDF